MCACMWRSSAATERALTPSEFAKCRSKGFCTFHDLVEPGRSYVYTITAHNAVGSSSSAQILCGTQPAPDAARCAAPAEGGAATPTGALHHPIHQLASMRCS